MGATLTILVALTFTSNQTGAEHLLGNRIRDDATTELSLSAARSIHTYVGDGTGYSGDGGLATAAKMRYPVGMAIDPSTGDLYIADSLNNAIRMVTKSTGIITTVAGNGVRGYDGVGILATSGRLLRPTDVAIDPFTGDLYIADTWNRVIRLVTKSTGIITAVVGTRKNCYSGDGGPAINATVSSRLGIDVDPSTGNLYIADSSNNVIRMITKSTGIISTIAGTGTLGYSGDGGPATSASLGYPRSVAIAAVTGDIYIADTFNDVIRMITKSTGIITTIAGNGTSGYTGDGGLATSAKLWYPSDVAIDALTGNIYIADTFNDAIRMITKSTGIITTIAGTGRSGYSDDGGPAMLSNPYNIVMDASSGMMYIADYDNNVIRSVIMTLDVTATPVPSRAPSIAVSSILTVTPSSAAKPVPSRAPSVAVSSILTVTPSSADIRASVTSDSNKGQQSGFSKIMIVAIIAAIATANWFY